MHEQCQAELAAFKNMPLSEQVAEGWHRGARLSKIRAASSKVPWVLSSCRLAENLELCQKWCDTPAGREAFEFEWRNYKRILQARDVEGRALWRPVRLDSKRFMRVVYRYGEQAHKDWRDIASATDRQITDQPVHIQLRAEYMQSILQVQEIYSIRGAGHDRDQVIFEVLHKTRPCNSSRGKQGSNAVVQQSSGAAVQESSSSAGKQQQCRKAAAVQESSTAALQ